jgi:ferredoxin-NADP reductase
MHRLRLFTFLGLAFVLSEPAQAGGTVAFAELEALLRQKPQVMTQLKAEYSLPNSAYAEIRLGHHFEHLSGARTGPYTFQALKRGQGADTMTKVLVCTDVQFMSSAGKPLDEPNWEKATHIRETLTSVSYLKPDAPPVCPR